jgi:hypothetical protein
MGQQGHAKDHRLDRGVQPIEHRAFAGAEGLVTLVADEALLLARMDTDGSRPIWSLTGQRSLGQNVVAGSTMVLLALCGSMPRAYKWTPNFITSELHHG